MGNGYILYTYYNFNRVVGSRLFYCLFFLYKSRIIYLRKSSQCYLIMASNTFISRRQFDDSVAILKKEEEVKNWVELESNVIFKVISITPRQSIKYGECFILLITTEAGVQTKAWGPTPLVRRIRQNRKPDEAVYFLSLGQEIINRTKKINRFELMFQKDRNVEPEIFVIEEQTNKEN